MKIVGIIATILVFNAISMRADDETIVTESLPLANHTSATSVTGGLVFTASDSDCRQVTVTANVRKGNGTMDGTTADDIWSCGVKWTFQGKVCLQTSWTRLEIKHDIKIEPSPGGNASGPIRLSGTASFAVPASAAILQFQSDPQKPLVFLLTAKGLKYVSGTGSIKAAGGKLYNFSGL
ncbi:MAG TPA: hypothetical protein VKV04_00345 [Verrucomicrobiae bacterium]|nr:hypothetical protein [Verrucomicrobiae bacterium]